MCIPQIMISLLPWFSHHYFALPISTIFLHLNKVQISSPHSKAGELNGYPYWGTLSVYSGGGYVLALEGSKTDLQAMMERLERENWIDKYTRAVFVEFTVYNAQVKRTLDLYFPLKPLQ